MSKINQTHQFTLTISELNRPFLEMILRSKAIELSEAIELAKCDDEEEKVYQLENNLWAVEHLLDQLDLQVQEAELKMND